MGKEALKFGNKCGFKILQIFQIQRVNFPYYLKVSNLYSNYLFFQDLVSVHATEDKKEILTLDHVKERLVCTPDFEELLKGDKKS